ncbi:hypothetical protein IFM89_005895 [Coptis chinensis]|uniref:Uncharacterized protein n=1 Tax=Coptis chinensis TaxID=261450 RepID=A0A835LV03_9MAGN|nr:hypothetical protein IFM89_005895 [Coptis chinensis]
MEEAGDVERGNMEIDSIQKGMRRMPMIVKMQILVRMAMKVKLEVMVAMMGETFRPHSNLRYNFELPRVKRHSKSNVQYEDPAVSLQWIRVMLDRMEPVEYDILEETGQMIQRGIDACADAIPADALRYF